MSIRDRLRRLEQRRSRSCPECRLEADRCYVYYPEEGEPVPEPERCAACGRSLGFVIRVVYESDLDQDLTLEREGEVGS